MTTRINGMQPSVAAILRAVWPDHTAKAAADVTGRSHRTVENWLQGRGCGDWDVLIALMASNETVEREILARVRAEREKTLDGCSDGAGHGVAPQARRVGAGGVARGAPVPGAAPGRVPDGTATRAVKRGTP